MKQALSSRYHLYQISLNGNIRLSKVDRIERKRTIMIVSSKVNIILFVACFIVVGCTLINSKKDTENSQESTVLIGRIYAKDVGNGPIIVAACSTSEGKEIAHYTVLHESGEYELTVDQGNYYVFAFLDKNSNLMYETGEPAGQYGDPKLVYAPDVGAIL